MALSLVTGPTTEPLTLAEVKAHLRLDSTSGECSPTALTAALASPAAPGNVENGAHRYRVTFVTADGETEAGEISAAVTVADKTVNGQVSLTAIPLGGSVVTSRKVYRTTAGGSTYLLLTTIADNTTTTYTDNTADASLGAAAPSTNTTLDPMLNVLIKAARQHVESHTSRALITQTWDWKGDSFRVMRDKGFPNSPLVVPLAPLISVTSVTYLDQDGASQTWSSSTGYQTDIPTGNPWMPAGRIMPREGQTWPDTQSNTFNAVTIRFVCGYGAASAVPLPLKQAMLLLIGHWYEHREAVNIGNIVNLVTLVPLGFDDLLYQFRNPPYGGF